ncbi:MAG TPA: hypothetical protein VE974_11320 [Thermoanaerobaculia bacterium]|nr:hypothetical protein [Thermoanaerobaculia bacterium]
MKRLVFFLLSLAVATRLGATAQAPDVLKIGAKTYFIHTNPLAPVLAASPGRLPEPEVHSTGLWRGYIATWSVRDKQLFLEDVGVPTRKFMDDVPESEQLRSAMKALFGEAGPRPATWFTGHLVVPTGEIVDYVHMGYGSTYSSYLVLTIVRGALQNEQAMNREEFERFRRAQYAAYRKTPQYAQSVADAKRGEDRMPDERIEEFLFQFAAEEYLSRVFEPASP